MDKDFVWEAQYGRRKHLKSVFKDLLRKQSADSLQCLALYVNNNPHNLEFYIFASYASEKKEDIEYIQKKFKEAGLIYRQDLTHESLMKQMQNRRFNSITLLDENTVDIVMDNGLFVFAEIEDMEANGYYDEPFGKEKEVFLSHSSKDKEDVERLIPYLNAMNLPVWFDKYNIDVGQSIVEKVQEGVEKSYAVIFWITENFLQSKWCKMEMRAFIRRMIDEEILVISILDENTSIESLPFFLRDIKCVQRDGKTLEEIVCEMELAFKKYFNIEKV